MVIGNGAPDQIQGFIEYTNYSGTIMTDPGLKTYESLGFKREISGIFSVATLAGGLKALKSGHRQAKVQGDALQLGGVIVIGPGPAVYYYYRSKKAGDHPPVEQILEACTSKTALYSA